MSTTQPPPDYDATPELSVVVPCFNESARIPACLDELGAYLRAQFPGRAEVIVVDDGSSDGSAALVRRRYPAFRVVTHARNRGKGAAVRTGMLAARGTFRLFVDADGATPIEEEARLRQVLAARADVAIGSRSGGSEQEMRFFRLLVGKAFAWLVRRLLGLTVADSQCGFKMFRADAAERIFSRSRIDGFAFDTEVLSLARALELRVTELPVRWHEQSGSKVRVWRDAGRMVLDVLRIRRQLAQVVPPTEAEIDARAARP